MNFKWNFQNTVACYFPTLAVSNFPVKEIETVSTKIYISKTATQLSVREDDAKSVFF